MEPRASAAGSPEPAAASSSFQARLWKNLQLGVGKGKGGGSGRAGAPERRTADTPSPSPPLPGARREGLAGLGGAGSRWSGFKKRKQVLDRVFSSSQPNLCCSSPEPLEPRGAGRAEQGSTLRRRIREHLFPAGRGPVAAAGATPPGGRSPDSAPSSSSASSSLSSSPQPPPRGARAGDAGARREAPAAHLCHQKSSSLPGTACLEQLLEPPPPRTEPAPNPAEPRTPEKGEERSSSPVSDRWARPEPKCAGPRLQLRAIETLEVARGRVGCGYFKQWKESIPLLLSRVLTCALTLLLTEIVPTARSCLKLSQLPVNVEVCMNGSKIEEES